MSVMDADQKEALFREIQEAEGSQTNSTPLAGLIRRWLECPDSQEASSSLARALSLQGSGDPVFPEPGIWPIPPA
jgi:hypothetical protein